MKTDNGVLTVLAEHGLDELEHPDVIVVPGGPGEVDVRAGSRVLEWLRGAHETSTWTTSVCTGSLILAAAGLLEGKHATSHWLALERLKELGALPSEERVVYDGKLVTAAGVSAGIDMGLSLAGRIAGRHGRPGDPAGHRVRPPAALRQRLAAQGARRGRGAAARPQPPPGRREQAVAGCARPDAPAPRARGRPGNARAPLRRPSGRRR